MTQEEIAQFALMLGEADRVRAMIAEDEAAIESNEGTQQAVTFDIAA